MSENKLVKIKPNNSFVSFELQEIWRYRELLYFLAWREVKVKYKQTFIGLLWVILQPVLTTLIFTLVFGRFAHPETSKIPYPLFALSGILLWLFINSSISLAGNSLTNNTNLVTKIYIPRLIVPISFVLANTIDFIIGFLVLVLLMLFYGIGFTAQLLFLPLFFLLGLLLAVGLGSFFCAVNVRFRDVKHALPFALQIWMFASPIFYNQEIIPEKWRFLLMFNPLTGILEGFRSSLFGLEFAWTQIGVSAVLTIFLFLAGVFVFKQMEDDFADLI